MPANQAVVEEVLTPRAATTVQASAEDLVTGAILLHKDEEGQVNSSPSLPKVKRDQARISTTDLATLAQAQTQC